MKVRIFTTVSPLFVAEGYAKTDENEELLMFFFSTYSDAQKKGVELINQHYHKISCYRAGE